MYPVTVDIVDDCHHIRLASGPSNALTTSVLDALLAALAEARGAARGVLLCGGERFFSNGADLDWALTQSAAGMRAMFLTLGECVLALLEAPQPAVAAARGHAVGAGLALLTACDYRYAADGRVLLGKPEVPMGIPNPYFADQLLRFIVGDFIASDLVYSGRLVPSAEAHTLGLLHGTAAGDAVEAIAAGQLKRLCALPADAFAESKHMRTARLCADLRLQMSARVARQVEIWRGAEAQALLRAAADRLRR